MDWPAGQAIARSATNTARGGFRELGMTHGDGAASGQPGAAGAAPGAAGGAGAASRPEGGSRPLDQLLSAVARGDEPAYESVYDLTSGWVLGVASRVLPDPAPADEVLQE